MFDTVLFLLPILVPGPDSVSDESKYEDEVSNPANNTEKIDYVYQAFLDHFESFRLLNGFGEQ